MSKKVFFIIILVFLLLLNIAIIIVSALSRNGFDGSCLKFILVLQIIVIYIYAIFVWQKETECELKNKQNFLNEQINQITETVKKATTEKQNVIYEMDKESIKSILKEIRKEDNNIVFLRTLADAILSENGRWNCKNIEKLLTIIHNISKDAK